MPNWVQNQLIISGDEEAVRKNLFNFPNSLPEL